MKKMFPKKRFSQNFLNDENILEKIANAINVEDKKVIEIGPGQGSLTKHLIKKAKEVIAFEIDYNLVEFLEQKFKDAKNLKIINQDFLKINLGEYHEFNIIANIPYNISTDILFKIFENSECFKYVVLLVQKEYAERMSANIGEKSYGKLALTTKIFYDCRILFDVSPKSFFPQPKVISSVIVLTRKENKLTHNQKWEFANFIKTCFLMKRKTLINNLKSSNYDLKKIEDFFLKNNLKKETRSENLDFETFWNLYSFLNEN